MAVVAGQFLDALTREAAVAITASLRSHEGVRRRVASLLRATGADAGDAMVQSAMDRLIELLDASGVVEAALRASVLGCERARDAGIRAFFLDPKETYSLQELGDLWDVPLDDVLAIYREEAVEWSASHPRQPAAEMTVMWPDALGASLAFHVIRPFDIERALGRDFTRVRPENWKTLPVVLRLPQWIADRLQREPSLPSNLDLAGRIEQLLLASMQVSGR
ncbi:MAG TPA: hypothetical protein VNA69_12850 [Thermoanaerobaculia bacterium]|nr:hypothetical protein [Thermoanaerobaculia bacterium]